VFLMLASCVTGHQLDAIEYLQEERVPFHSQPQSELLRPKARAAIPHVLTAIAAINERHSGRSDRSADFRVLASWFATCADDEQSQMNTDVGACSLRS
jgi:hypothetical protein